MALSIKEILTSAKIEGLELVKVKTGGEGDYFLATLGGIEKSIMVHTIGQLTRAEWVDALRGFAEQVAGLAPVEEAPVEEAPVEEAPVEEAPVEEAPAEEAPAAPARRYNRVDGEARYWVIDNPERAKRREGSSAYEYECWMFLNPGATAAEIKAAGHDLKHLRWDLKVGAVIAERN